MRNATLLLLLSFSPTQNAPDNRTAVDYLRDIKPILAKRCYACHAAIKQRGGLRLDTATLLKKGGDSGPAVLPKNSEKSLLLQRLLGQNGLSRMPPKREGVPLKAAEVALIRRWIDQGAPVPKDEVAQINPRNHWAFKKPVRPSVPKVKNAAWVRNPIDAFIAREHEKRRLRPQPPAAQRLLLRRVYLDLIGLPPTSEELESYLEEAGVKPHAAYEKVVDRLLNSPQYGERWGRHWMDIWRYSDWWGLGKELRNSQKHMWHWRNWIVESLNKDKGYDRMILEMLAADELYPTDADALRGTGFLARHYFKFNRTTWLDEAIEHTSKAFLGLTMNCSKCHDHKYDPIQQLDYYRFRAFFEPYQIRLDRVPGEIDLAKDGIPRVFDCNLDTPTYLHIRGNAQQPDKKRRITPGLPRFFAAEDFKITPIELPAEAVNPGLREFVLQDHLKVAERELAAARKNLAGAKRKRVVAEKQIEEAEQKIATLKARAAADREVAREPESAETKKLIQQAAIAEKKLAVARAEVGLVGAMHQLSKNKNKKSEQKLKQAKSALANARKALANPGLKYTPLTGALKTLESNLESEASRRKPFPKTSTGRRTALAKWIASRNNPLTARVTVNHIWARHFGQPLVATVFDFGSKGKPPTHPELLDWLAVEFMENGWSLKHLHRLIVTSNTYRMTSTSTGAAASNKENDGDNKYYWRMNSKRMESQLVRDGLLHLAGELDLKLGGPSIEEAQQQTSRRRSLYFFHSAIKRNRFLSTFDEADPLDCYRRRESIVPQQALALANSKLALRMSEKITQRLEKLMASRRRQPAEKNPPDREFARVAFTLVLCYEPKDKELSACEQAMTRWRTIYEKQSDPGHRARSHLVHALLNHNDFVVVR